ncbi:hypothetical protein [Hymenobacter sp. UYCo722]|uniref:hypothetical protein n=1 Tax=Hymenobacter sp. UYCo722 TaxID=3156335 RepID=UPI003392F58C
MKGFFARRSAMPGMLLAAWLVRATFPAVAQTPALGRAEIFAVLGAGKGAQFSLPQVRLADELAAERINRAIARAVVSAADAPVDTTVALARQLRQIASQPCCLRGGRFQTLLNQGSLLSLKLTLEINGAYYYERPVYLVFDLSTGQRLTLAALIADPPAQLARRLEGAVNRRIGEFLGDTATGEHAGRSDLAARFGWDFTTRRVRFSTADALTGIPAPDLGEFALTPHTLLLFYRVGLPATMLADTPDDTYRFPYARLQTRGRLAELVLKSSSGGR